jgi:hypothetical protein
MIKPEVLDALVAAGCTAEQIAAAVKASMGNSSGAARQAAYRARQKENKESDSNVSDVTVTDVTSRCVTVDNVTDNVTDGFSLSPVPLLPPTPPNNPLTPKPSSKNNQRGSRLPADWTMNGPDLAYALSKNLSEPEAFDLFERFCSWAWSASGANAVKVNWHQAWQGWVQREAGKIIAARASNRSQGPPEGKGGFVSILMDKHRERQNGTGTNEPEFFEH